MEDADDSNDTNIPVKCETMKIKDEYSASVSEHQGLNADYEQVWIKEECASDSEHPDYVKCEPVLIKEECNASESVSGSDSEQNLANVTHSSPIDILDRIQFTCLICLRSYKTKRELYVHMKHHDYSMILKECKICHKLFEHNSTLTLHLCTHTGEKPYECSICHKRFAHQTGLVTHMRIHTDDRKFECDICHKRFLRKVNFTTHMHTHTGEKPYECDICHKRFTQKSILTRHKRTHTGETPYECDICYKRFNQKAHLTFHVRIHTRDKTHECGICHKRFIQKSNLTRHTRTHTRVYMPYTVCTERLSRDTYQQTHEVERDN